MEITKKEFMEYVNVQNSGDFNMFDPRAREETSLSKPQWLNIMSNYSLYSSKWNI